MRQIHMLKKDAVEFFGGTWKMARALELGTHSAISNWPDVLTTAQADRVRGAAIRLSKPLPDHLREARLQRKGRGEQNEPVQTGN